MKWAEKISFDIKKLPDQLLKVMSLIGVIVGFVNLVKGNFYLVVLIAIILFIVWLLRWLIKIAFQRSEPLVVGGTGFYTYEKYRNYALGGISVLLIFIIGSPIVLFVYQIPYIKYAFIGTFTPTPTNTFTPTPAPTNTPTATLVPPADSLYYLFVMDASARMKLSFNGSETKWDDLQASALNHLIYGLPERANYGLIVLGGNLFNSTVNCDVPNQQTVTFNDNTKMTLIQTIRNVQPYGVASLADAIILARRIFEDKRGDVHRKLLLFLGGGDDCSSDKWVALKYFLSDYEKSGLIDVYTEVVILPDESIDDAVIDDLQTEITRLGIEEEVVVSAPKNDQELQTVFVTIFNESIAQARDYEPVAVAAQERINAAKTQTPIPASIPSKAVVGAATATARIPSAQPSNTQTPIFVTAIPLPTNTLPPPPTSTSTSIPPTEAPKPFLILNPPNGTSYGCSSEALCIQTVTVQWVPQTQTGGKYLSIWVRPLPSDPNQDYYVQASPYYLSGSQWTSTEVYIGQVGDSTGTPFKVCALVTNQVYSRGEYYYELPASSLSYCVNVTR